VSVDVRSPTEAERNELVQLLSTALNFTPDDRHASRTNLEEFRCVFQDDRMVASAAAFPFRQWFGGNDLRMAGIYGVATLPEHRASGRASMAVERILRESRASGIPTSALFPAVLRPYRKLGFELAGSYVTHRLPLEAIPSDVGDPGPVQLATEADEPAMLELFSQWIRRHNGTIEPVDKIWWHRRTIEPLAEGIYRAVVVRAGDRIDGMAAFSHGDDPGRLDSEFGLRCRVFAWRNEQALRSLLAFFRTYRGLGRWVAWQGPPEDPVGMLIPEQSLERNFTFGWMLRLLDVQACFEHRGYPEVDAEVLFAVDDPLFAENAGPWRVSVTRGKPSVELAPEARVRPIPIGIVSALFSGYLRGSDASRLGFLDPDSGSAYAFEALLAGPEPWCPFFF
jgi:predicted acetyltransferase